MTSEHPLVTVVIPAYNRAHSIGAAVQSAISQDYPNLEVIVIDDGSTDGTSEVVAAIANPAVRCIRQANSGANVARNRGISEAQGEYIALLDSDDTFLPGHISRSIRHLEKDPGSAVFSRIVVDRGSDRKFLKPPRAPKEGEPISEYLSCAAGFVQTSTVVVRTETARTARYLEWLPYGQDVDFAIRVERAGYRWHMINDPGAVWNDVKSGSRISARTDPAVRLRWAEEAQQLLTKKALRGFKGWRVAKAYAEHGQTLKGLTLWLEAAVTGTYAPKHAAIVFLQVALANGWYRKVADVGVGLRSSKK